MTVTVWFVALLIVALALIVTVLRVHGHVIREHSQQLLVEKWRKDAARHKKHGDCYRVGEGWGLEECADELDALLVQTPEEK
jgi:hypothetical protein